MNEMQVFRNSEFGELGVIEVEGKVYFPATACARKLGYKNPQEAIRTHCKGVSEILTPTKGGNQSIKIIPEGDLYRLIVSSKLPSAEKFERWVFDEVLPSIRQRGGYMVDGAAMAKQIAEVMASTIASAMAPVVERLERLENNNINSYHEPVRTLAIPRVRKISSLISKLDPELRYEVEEMILSGRYTYVEIKEYMEEFGVSISCASITKMQLESAKEEVKKPFLQAEELKTKSIRLDEVNHLLDMTDKKGTNEIKDDIDTKPMLEDIKLELTKYFEREYEEEYSLEDFNFNYPDLKEIGIAYTNTPDEKYEIQVNLDLEKYQLTQLINGIAIETTQYSCNKEIASDIHELLQIKEDIKYWDFNELVRVDEEKLEEKLGLLIDDEGNFYDPLAKDYDLDGVVDRFDADFKDSNVQSYGELHNREKSKSDSGDKRESVMSKLDYYKEVVKNGGTKDTETKEKETIRENAL